MSYTPSSNVIGGQIAEAFGIKHCKELVLKFKTNSRVVVEATFYLEEEELKKLPAIFKKYELVLVEEKEAV